MSGWKEQAKALFFVEHMNITEIAAVVGRSRQTVSAYVNACDGYGDEMALRAKRGADARRAYQRNWDRENRARRYGQISGDTIRREHETAARILSGEQF